MSILSSILPTHPHWTPLLIFLARMMDVSMGTVRVICLTRGQRAVAIALGFCEMIIWVFAVSSVFSQLDRPINILAFAGGYAAGMALGLWIEGRLALGVQIVSFISIGPHKAVAERLRFGGFLVTSLEGSGRDGPVSICMAVVPRRQTTSAIRMAKEIDCDVVVTVEDVRETTAVRTCVEGAGKIPLLWYSGLLSRIRGPR